jgi:hypothetical protein
MGFLIVEERPADIVRAGNDLDLLTVGKPPRDGRVVGDKRGIVALSDKGQHAEQVMRPQPDDQLRRPWHETAAGP